MRVELLYFALGCVFLHRAVTAEQPPATHKDPCQNVFCTKGRMCVVNKDRSTTCVCPQSCPDEYNPVCSVYLRQFNNKCELHKFACRIGIMMAIERTGKCDFRGSDLEPCPVSRLLQFHDRYLEYLMAARERELDPNFTLESKRLDSLTESEERKQIIEWEFSSQDSNQDGILDEHEIEAMIDRDEDCMVGFMKSCDYDHHPGISRREWNTCFPPMVAEATEESMES
ncbi:hypothetical protein OS493_002145 [Desmophyllum pertusum]|uniref:Kazal-like domain-containing protein n=1 Tax=Desmophyllum pertusum TaxID=174260 RepID=A0A9W9Z5N6_9CNID|nr:hypothetical protein OS493_002145 [Desmophyllum pertusum]